MATKRKPKRHTIVVQEWLESERGWGQRPDGASLHLNETDRKEYCDDYWAEEKKRNTTGEVPDEYDRPDGNGYLLDVSAKIYNKIKKSKNGIRIFEDDLRSLKT